MADFNKIIQQIKENDLKTASLTREIKEMEAQIKLMETERLQITSCEKELVQNMFYKNQLVDNKMCERRLLQDQLDTLVKMVGEAEENLETQTAKLETAQHELWDIRINFSKDTNEFLSRHDCLIENKNKIQELAKRRKAAKLMKEEMRQLEHSIASLEAQFRYQKSQLDIIEHLKMDKQVLNTEPDGGEYKRLRSKIDVYQRELDKYNSLESNKQNLSKYLDTNLLGPQISITSISAEAQKVDNTMSTPRMQMNPDNKKIVMRGQK